MHAGVGLMQGEIGIHTARNFEMPMVVMSGESITYGEDPNVEPGAQWYGSLGIVGGLQRILEPVTKWAQQAGSWHYRCMSRTVRAPAKWRSTSRKPRPISTCRWSTCSANGHRRRNMRLVLPTPKL